MIVSSIAKVGGSGRLEDIYFRNGSSGELEEVHREPSSVEALYEVIIELDDEQHSFMTEVRTGKGGKPQIDWDDDLSDLMTTRGLSPVAWNTLSRAVFAVHMGELSAFPVELL